MPSMFLRLLAVAAVLATGALANPLVPGDGALSGATSAFNPMKAALHPLERRMTNGQRMARGLPPNKPHFRRQASTTNARPRPRPSSAPGTASAQSCTPRNGVIHVTSSGVAGDDARPPLDGYLISAGNEFGEFGYTTDRSAALTVTIDDCNGSPFDIVSSNGYNAFPMFGGIKGFSSDSPNLASGSLNYLYFGGVSQTAPFATPQNVPNSFSAATDIEEAAESAIWSFQSGTNVLQANWVNTDGSLPKTNIVFVNVDAVFALLGDIPAFERAFERVTPVTFTFEG